MKYTIAFVTNNYTPYSGGVVQSIQAMVNEFKNLGHCVYIIAPDFLGDAHKDPAHVFRIPSLFRFRYKNNYMAIPWRAYAHLDHVLHTINPDVIHVHHPFLLGPMAVRWAKEHNIKTIFTYHTIYEQYAHYVPLPSQIVCPVVTRLVLQFCKTVDHIIVPSKGMHDYLLSHGISHTSVIPSGIRPDFLIRQSLHSPLSKPYRLLYVGRFVQEKNISVLFHVMKKLPKCFTLTLIGYGADTDSLMTSAYDEFGFSRDRIRFVVKPDLATLRSAYAQAHIFLFPSQSDTQGLVLAESMAHGTPVVALDGIGQRDVIEQGKNGFIVSDIDQMIETIQAVVKDRQQYFLLREYAWQMSQRYHPHILSQKVLALYEG